MAIFWCLLKSFPQAEPENEYHLPPVSEVTLEALALFFHFASFYCCLPVVVVPTTSSKLEDLLAPLQGETRFSQEVKQLKA